MDSITLSAPAKINLYLDVINRRPDGYHNIRTIFQKVGLSDRVTLRKTKKGITLDCRYPHVPKARANIAYKAALLMKREFGIDGLSIKITKNIPPAAGLGGGSSDAASVIIAIDRLFGLKIPKGRLITLASRIGADVPFFISGYKAATGEGIGDRLKELRHSTGFYILLILPGFMRIYTKTIYRNLSLPLTKRGSGANMLAHALKSRNYSKIKKLLFNRLEEVVLAQHPIVKEAKEALSSFDTEGVLLSGSGPTVFGLFKDREEAMRAKSRIARDKRWRTVLTKTV